MSANTELMAKLIKAGLEWIVHRLAGERTAEAIDQVDDVARTLLEGVNGKADPQVVSTMLMQFTDDLRANDDAAEAELRRKFDTSDT